MPETPDQSSAPVFDAAQVRIRFVPDTDELQRAFADLREQAAGVGEALGSRARVEERTPADAAREALPGLPKSVPDDVAIKIGELMGVKEAQEAGEKDRMLREGIDLLREIRDSVTAIEARMAGGAG